MNNIINLRLAHSAYVGHENNYGTQVLSEKPPSQPTFLGVTAHPDRPPEQHDTWRFFVTFKFGYSKLETFYGERARNLWAEWKRIQFSKAKRTKSRTSKKKHEQQPNPNTNSQLALV